MQIELHCPACHCRFAASPDASFEEVHDKMFEQGPLYQLGDGNTFEDMIFHRIMDQGAIQCPECGDDMAVNEESLSRLAMDMLAGI